jgi:DNA repair photolyase
MGCQHGCAFCYAREMKYIPHKPKDPDAIYDEEADDFSHLIKVKENAPYLLRKALGRVPVDMVFTGDYQPAERKFMLSRRMLEVCHELGFPVFILSRSPLVLRDLDLLQEINQHSNAVVAFSIIITPESSGYESVSRLEGLSPSAARRFEAMAGVAALGILTGTVAMPLLPGLCEHESNLYSLAKWTADHGGKFVLAGGLTLADQQKTFFLNILHQKHPELMSLYTRLYPPGSYAQTLPWQQTGLRVHEAYLRYGISDRIPRPIIPGEKRALNKRIVEQLAYALYMLELENAGQAKIWEYRKAAWAVEDLEQDIRLLYHTMGLRGLESLPEVKPAFAREIESLITSSDEFRSYYHKYN